MPILDYTGANSGLFVHLGSGIARINSYEALGKTTLANDLQSLLTTYGLTWLPHEGIAAQYEQFRDNITQIRETIASYIDRRLVDYNKVLKPLGLYEGSSTEETLINLKKAMKEDNQTVKACLCSISSPTYKSTNYGNGKLYNSLILDGFNPPLQNGYSDYFYSETVSQLCVPSEKMVLECVSDSWRDGLPIGGELWKWNGGNQFSALDVRDEGSGAGPSIQTVDSSSENMLSNPSFDTWSNSSSAPSGWTKSGTLSRSSIPLYSGYSCAFNGTGSLSQKISSFSLQSRRCYFVGFSARSLFGGPVPGVNVYFSLSGSSFLPGPQASLDCSTFSGTAWKQCGAFVITPSLISSDINATVYCSGPGVIVDSLCVVPVQYHGGLTVAIQSGSNPFQIGDKITFDVSNNQAGKFQNFFRKWYKTQLPSVNSSSTQGTFLTLLMLQLFSSGQETISDTLVS